MTTSRVPSLVLLYFSRIDVSGFVPAGTLTYLREVRDVVHRQHPRHVRAHHHAAARSLVPSRDATTASPISTPPRDASTMVWDADLSKSGALSDPGAQMFEGMWSYESGTASATLIWQLSGLPGCCAWGFFNLMVMLSQNQMTSQFAKPVPAECNQDLHYLIEQPTLCCKSSTQFPMFLLSLDEVHYSAYVQHFCPVLSRGKGFKFRRLNEAESRHAELLVFVSMQDFSNTMNAGNVIIFSRDDVLVLLHKHIGQGEVVDHLWKGQMGLSVEQQKQTLELWNMINGGKESLEETGTDGASCNPAAAGGCCQGNGESILVFLGYLLDVQFGQADNVWFSFLGRAEIESTPGLFTVVVWLSNWRCFHVLWKPPWQRQRGGRTVFLPGHAQAQQGIRRSAQQGRFYVLLQGTPRRVLEWLPSEPRFSSFRRDWRYASSSPQPKRTPQARRRSIPRLGGKPHFVERGMSGVAA